jgi:CRP-like cAMP-binding protein
MSASPGRARDNGRGAPVEPMLSIVERALLLMEIDVFKDLSTEQVARIAARTTERRAEKGELIPLVERGMFYVIEGRIEMLVAGGVVRVFPAGTSFGLAALMGPENADQSQARAAEPSHLLYLPKEDFLETVQDHPEVAVALLKRLSGIILELFRRVQLLEHELSVPVPENPHPREEPSSRDPLA